MSKFSKLVLLVAIVFFTMVMPLCADFTITTNELTIEQAKELIQTGKTAIAEIKGAGGFQAVAFYWKVFIVFGCLYVIYKLAQLIAKFTKNKKDDEVVSKVGKIIEKFIKPIMQVVFGKLK